MFFLYEDLKVYWKCYTVILLSRCSFERSKHCFNATVYSLQIMVRIPLPL